MNTPVTITQKFPDAVKADLQELLHDQRKQLRALETGLKEQAHAVSQAHRVISAAQHEFRTTLSEVERAKRLIESLEETIAPVGEHPFTATCAEWSKRHSKYDAVPVFYNRTDPVVEIRRRGDDLLLGTIFTIHPVPGGTTFVFTPFKSLDQNFSGPFDSIADAMDCADAVTPFDPEIHGWGEAMTPAMHSGFHY